MMVTQPGRPTSTHRDQEIHATDLSPTSSVDSGSSIQGHSQTSSPSPTSSAEKNILGTHLLHALNGHQRFPPRNLSPLQRLQFAFERTTILSNPFPVKEEPIENQLTPLSPLFRIDQEILRSRSPDQLIIDTEKGNKHGLTPQGHGSPNSDPANIFQCPLCSLVCNGRHSFNEHLVTHTQHHACPKCDYLTTSDEKCRDHLLQHHGMSDPVHSLEEEETLVPKLNAQGRVKTFKCKQCDHLSFTKVESWAHSATHIRPEKMLKCPKCPFVTEYKHHLEYHLRIHVGSKPYQCHVCSYTCVNKSMLNSHLKSHSAVYQYNCLDCDYQTKYCHSLKMHLRKLNHRPSMVLNPDGTPNPLPIIDVYGTRRGPKMKKNNPIPATLPSKPITHVTSNELAHSPPTSIHSNQSSYSSQDSPGYHNLDSPKTKLDLVQPNLSKQKSRKDKNGEEGGESSDSELEQFHVFDSTGGDSSKFETKTQPLLDLTKNPLQLYAAALNQYLLSNPLLFGSAGQEHFAHNFAKEQEKQMIQKIQSQSVAVPFLNRTGHFQLERRHDIKEQLSPSSSVALDLRHPKAESERRRRKGKAHRYERRVFNNASEEDTALDFSNNNNYKAQKQFKIASRLEPGLPITLTCNYCEISFLDQVLYRMHMSYHSGEPDPFVCNSCGKMTKDKISFCLHLTTDSH